LRNEIEMVHNKVTTLGEKRVILGGKKLFLEYSCSHAKMKITVMATSQLSE